MKEQSEVTQDERSSLVDLISLKFLITFARVLILASGVYLLQYGRTIK